MHRTALLVLSASMLPGAAQAADMIVHDGYRQTRHQAVAVHTTMRYVAYSMVCDDLLLTYRAPLEPAEKRSASAIRRCPDNR